MEFASEEGKRVLRNEIKDLMDEIKEMEECVEEEDRLVCSGLGLPARETSVITSSLALFITLQSRTATNLSLAHCQPPIRIVLDDQSDHPERSTAYNLISTTNMGSVGETDVGKILETTVSPVYSLSGADAAIVMNTGSYTS